MKPRPPRLDALAHLYTRYAGQPPALLRRLAGDGSARSIYRLADEEGASVVGVLGTDPRENRAFLAFTGAFAAAGLPVPRIQAADEAAGVWIEDDLGDTTLFDMARLARKRSGEAFPDDLLQLYRDATALLPHFQVEAGRHAPFDAAWPRPEQDGRAIRFDLNAFEFQFVRPAGIAFDEARLEDDFERFTNHLLEAERRHFLHRDFQSRNLMVLDGSIHVIDYQNGRRGALAYDLASLLHDAKVGIPRSIREGLLTLYLETLSDIESVDEGAFRESYRLCILLRTLQALGAYGLRGLTERKPSFLARIPARLADVEALLDAGGVPGDLPELTRVLARLAGDPTLRRRAAERDEGGLQIHIGSFAYKHGYPADRGGHGGGYVFDCRGIENPGRQIAYAGHNGRDADVARFLEQAPGAVEFLDRTVRLVDDHLQVWRERGFAALDVHYGCTGGQHRSVWCAEALARHLRETAKDVRVRLTHREEDRWRRLTPLQGV